MSVKTEVPISPEAAGIYDHVRTGNLEKAEQAADALVAREPANPLALYLRAHVYRQRNDASNAILYYNKALRLKPDFKKACGDLAIVLQQTGQMEFAFRMYEHQIKIEQSEPAKNPANHTPLSAASRKAVQEWMEKGKADYARGLKEQSLASFRKAYAICPYHPDILVNLGIALWALGRNDESEEMLMECLRIAPNDPAALNQLGNAYKERRYLVKAIAAYRLCHAAAPDYRQPLVNLGKTYFELLMYPESVDAYERTLKVQPDFIEALGEVTYLRQMLCRWGELDAFRDRIVSIMRKGEQTGEPFIAMVYAPADVQYENARRWARKLYPGGLPWKNTPPPAVKRGDGRLRIGYLSSDFQRHATTALISEIFEYHDRSRFEIYAYSHGIDDEGAERARIRAAADHFRDIMRHDDKDVCDVIENDGIDILVDLKGYTQNHRLNVMARRPAPVQMHYIGFPGTLGAPFIDYFIGDGVAAPARLDPFFTEKLIRLPHSYQINDRKRPLPQDGPTRLEYGLPEHAFVFCAINNSYKITPEVFSVWMRLLARVEGSVLWVLETHPESTQNLKREAKARGIDEARIVGAKTAANAEHLARYRFADILLDTAPVCGHTTASDALWCGVPVVTLRGESFISSVAASLLHAVELPQLVADNLEDYESIALGLALDPAKLEALRRHLQDGRMRFPLFDGAATTRALEAAYEHAVRLQAQGNPPQAFSLTPDLTVA